MKARVSRRYARIVTWLRVVIDRLRVLARTDGRVRAIGIGVVVLLAALAAGTVMINRMTGLPSDAAFKVGDVVITEQEFDHRLKVLGALYGIQQPASEKSRDGFRRDMAKAIATSMVLDDLSRERRIAISDKTARDKLSEMVEDQLGHGGRQQFVQLLATAGASEQDVIDELKLQHRVSKLFDVITEGEEGKVSDDMVRSHYEENRESMATPERRTISNIVVGSEETAREVLDLLKRGGDFGNLVRDYSLDHSTRDQDGNLGAVTRGQLEENYADAAFEVAKGSTFGPIETEHGWNIGKVVDIEAARGLEFDDVKDQIRNWLQNEIVLATWFKWVSKQLKVASVAYADEYRPDDPYGPPPATSYLPGTRLDTVDESYGPPPR